MCINHEQFPGPSKGCEMVTKGFQFTMLPSVLMGTVWKAYGCTYRYIQMNVCIYIYLIIRIFIYTYEGYILLQI